MKNKLGNRNARSVEIQRVHRISGRRGGSGPRLIIARFLRYKDVEDIFSLGRRLEGTDFQMFRDLPQEIIKRRKNQTIGSISEQLKSILDRPKKLDIIENSVKNI